MDVVTGDSIGSSCKLEPTLENAPLIYAETSVTSELQDQLRLNAKFGYRCIKRAFDVAASFCGMVLLSPIIIGTALAVKITSPGPIIFKQTRVGKDKTLFDIYKFRTMRVDTPDLPSHMINADDWLTPIGATLRKLSLDELPQMWNIFVGQMSVIGPRPALWNQFDLIAERDKWGANSVRPGLTGWAQINGRDELSVLEKSRLDGEYVRRRSCSFDLRCFFGTISKVAASEGVVEGQGNKAGD